MMNLHPNSTSETTKSRAWLPIVLCALLCGIAFGAGLFVSKLLVSKTDGYPVVAEWFGTVDEKTLVEPSQEGGEAQAEAPTDAPTELTPQTTALSIEWIDPTLQEEIPVNTVLYGIMCSTTDVGEGSPADQGGGMNYNPCLLWNNPIPDATAFRLGFVQGGAYDGWALEMHTFSQPGMGVYWESYYLLRDERDLESKPVLVGQMRTTGDLGYSRENLLTVEVLGWADRLSKLGEIMVDQEVRIPELEIESRLVDVSGRAFRFSGYGRRFDAMGEPDSNLETYVLSTTLEDGRELRYQDINDVSTRMVADLDVPVTASNQFYRLDEDGRVLWYQLEIPFWDYTNEDKYEQHPPRMTWNDGAANTMLYVKGQVGGCGFITVLFTRTDEEMNDLPTMVRVGTGVGNDGSQTSIFEPSTYDHPYYTEGFNALSPAFTEGLPEDERKAFVDLAHPYLYFQDTFGRWVELASIEIIPPVECGKPVIYLYPEQPTDLIVEVAPRGGFTYTQPAYRDGWRVTAYPDGRIVNRDDGLEYPYLFWEGRGGVYAPPTSYWVVERAGVEPFLRETLTSMNLIEPEIADFLEFWLPRMQAASFYIIGFHDTRTMDELAPLSLSVEPDHVFRILMDYEELDRPVASQPPARIPKANRDGFEVIEWGGVIR